MKEPVVVGFGSALVDILISETDGFIETSGIQKGGMVLVEEKDLHAVLRKTKAQPAVVPGGSACNTMIGIAKLGGKARFVGKCGPGEMGFLFEDHLMRDGVEARLEKCCTKTGRVVSIVTPDAQRSMLTYLGASAEITPQDIRPQCLDDAAFAHIEGYLCHQGDLIHHIQALAKRAGARICLDLASYTVIEAHRDKLDTLVRNGVDILIANEDEAAAFTGARTDRDQVKALANAAPIAVLKVGKRGSYIAANGDVLHIPALGDGDAVDTTGAGDLWAAGFLYGLSRGYSLEHAGKLASLCGYEVCQVMGAKISEDGWKRIRESAQQLKTTHDSGQ
ncbi:MAG: adenosine kinase [Thermodesulfobacteriota bacterium]